MQARTPSARKILKTSNNSVVTELFGQSCRLQFSRNGRLTLTVEFDAPLDEKNRRELRSLLIREFKENNIRVAQCNAQINSPDGTETQERLRTAYIIKFSVGFDRVAERYMQARWPTLIT